MCIASSAPAGSLSSTVQIKGFVKETLQQKGKHEISIQCDLLVFSGGIHEKLASGLVEPFVSHLKFAKDQIPKGGYSITLSPPTTDTSWFTKATFQRVVRFISTPEILERFVRIEKEIVQIESSVQSTELTNTNLAAHAEQVGSLPAVDAITKKSTDSSKLKDENGINDVVKEENSKVRLQRLLETRKALLRKEQAMAYARALVAGFEMENMADLISFADYFGASRLRQACTDFKELCKKKNTDGLWMDELAAMAACSPSELSYSGTSGIILTSESSAPSHINMLNFHSNGVSTGTLVPNGSTDDSTRANLDGIKDNDQVPPIPATVQAQMPWPNQIPQYMYNFQSSVQQVPQYQGFPFPGMHPVPPYYSGNMGWRPHVDESGHGPRHHKSSSRKKEKVPNGKVGPEPAEEDQQNESSDSYSGSDSDATTKHDRKHSSNRKKSTKTVVIRNINYITSKRRNGEKDEVLDDSSSVENQLSDEDSIEQTINDAVGSFGKHHKSKSHYNKKRGSNGSSNHDLEKDLASNISEGGKENGDWDAFQNLLIRDEELTPDMVREQQPMDSQDEHSAIRSSNDGVSVAIGHAIDLEDEKVTMQRTSTTDSFVVTERVEGNERRIILDDFSNGENFRPSTKMRDSPDAQLIISGRLEESGSNLQRTLSDIVPESSIIRNSNGEDCFVINHSTSIEQAVFNGNHSLSMEGDRSHSQTSKNVDPIDDSFMIQTQSSIDDQYDSQWKTDISMVAGFSPAPETGFADVSHVKHGVSDANEPDDLCVMLARESGVESSRASWTPEMDFGIEVSFREADKNSAPKETNDDTEEKVPVNSRSNKSKKVVGPGTNNVTKGARSNVLRGSFPTSRYDILAKSKTSSPSAKSRPVTQKSKLEREEEMRKKMEELVTERQRRIAERSAASGSTPAAPYQEFYCSTFVEGVVDSLE
ncbi:hypothetical protein RJ639_006662 [Escallonia herrerae]|uniref:COP1-interacting protein 7 n=1 Tax=Escallonia herrerae TaxID=1293975 RepID=A0AA88VU66_9ASTE|nr:hypothetical protein RJ639_006662 [Escallonia herrerae]